MAELLGTGYVVDYCISRYKHKQEEKVYRAYITDTLMTICNNFANAWGGERLTVRYIDLGKPKDTRTGDEIAIDIITRAGLTFGEEE